MTARTILPVAGRSETLRATGRLLWSRRGPLVVATIAFVVVALCGVVPPWMLGRIVDVVASGSGDLAWPVTAMVLATVVGACATWVSVASLARAGEPAVAALREQVVEVALSLDPHQLEHAGAGDLLSRVGDDSRKVTESVSEIVPIAINSGLLIVFTAGGLLALDWRLALAGLVAAPFYVLGLRWYLPRSAPEYAAERVAQGDRAQAVVSRVRGAETVRAYGLGPQALDEIAGASRRALGISVGVFRLLTRFFGRSNQAELAGMLCILVTGFWLVRGDLASVGAVTAAALYFHRLFNPIGSLMLVLDQLQSAGASLARLIGVAELPGRGAAALVTPPETEDESLRLRGVAHSYVPGRTALQPTDLALLPGRRVALVGQSGAGKTTLGAIAAGILEPTTGQVELDGRPVDEWPPAAVRSRVVLVSQDIHVFAQSVAQQLTLAAPEASTADIREALRVVDALGWVDGLPDGLDTVVGDGGHALTPAQAQQLALARVALADPAFVILDEATAEAGSDSARDLDRAALAVAAGRGALVVAHRLTQAEGADEVLVMHDGDVVERGSHAELVAARGRYGQLWAAWSGTGEEGETREPMRQRTP